MSICLEKKWLMTFIASILIVGCGSKGPEGMQQKMTVEVGVVTIKAEHLMLTRELPGRIVSSRVSDIRPQVNGIILKRAFEEGAFVREGDLLYQIDPAPYQAAYDQAKAAVSMAEANLPAVRSREGRLKELVTTHAVGEQDYDNALAALRQAEAQLEASKAALELARINLSYTPIKAPISGRIGRSSVTEGALVTAYQPVPLATIQHLDPIYVDVSQSTAELLRLQRRMSEGKLDTDNADQNKVTIVREDGTPYPQEGTLQFRDVTVNPTTGSVILRIEVPNPDNILLPGMFVRAVIKEGDLDDAILVTQSGVSRDQKGNPFVWVVDESGNTQIRMVTIDRAVGNRWLLSSGLNTGDKVIVKGIQRLRPGTPVTVTEESSS